MRAVSAVLVWGCLATGVSAQASSADPTGISTSSAIGRNVYCNIAPSEVIDLSAPLPGVVREVFVHPGDKVLAGQEIVRLDNDLLKAEFAIARARAENRAELYRTEAQLASSEARLKRIRNAYENKAIAADDLERAELEVKLAHADLQLAQERVQLAELDAQKFRLQLDQTVIHAPTEAVVGETLISVGESSLNQSLAQLFVVSPVRIEAFVASHILAAFMAAENHEAKIAGQSYPIEINHVSPIADQSSRSTSVYFYLDAEAVRPGLDCTVAFN